MQTGLTQRVQDILNINPGKGAIEFQQQWYSWGQLRSGMAQLETLFNQANIETGATIAIVLRNRPAHVACLLQIFTSHRCIAPINPFQSADKVANDIEQLNPSFIIADKEDWQKPELSDIVKKLGAVAISIDSELAGKERIVAKLFSENTTPTDGPYHEALPETAILMLTSGTTGPAKRIKLSRNSFDKSVMNAIDHYTKNDDALSLKPGVSLLSGPLVHIGGLYFVFDSIASGRSFCLLEKFNVSEWVRAVEVHRVKVAALPPTAIRMIYDAEVEAARLTSLRCIRAGSAPLPLDLQEDFEEKYDIPILDVYGATEFSGAIAGWTLKDHQLFSKSKRGAVGRAQPGVELRVIDPETSQTLPANSLGLLEVRSVQVGKNDWVRTTDLAELDEDGFLFIRGRADNAIIRGGFKILPLEVEALLLEHPAVKAACVFGIPDHRLGAVPVAGIELENQQQANEEELINYLREKTTSYKVPTKILIMDELPRTPSMKISIHELKKFFQ